MALIATTVPAAAGTVLSLGAVTDTGTGTDYYRNSGKEMVVVNNGSGGDITVTFEAVQSCNLGTAHDLVVTVSNGAEEWLPPVDPLIFNDDSGFTHLTFEDDTSVTVAVVSAT